MSGIEFTTEDLVMMLSGLAFQERGIMTDRQAASEAKTAQCDALLGKSKTLRDKVMVAITERISQ